MKATSPIVFALVLAGAMACVSQQQPRAEDAARDVAAINAVLAAHVAAVNSGNTAATLAGFTEDLIYLPPSGSSVRGKPAMAAFVGSFAEAFTAEISMVAEETILLGDWAFQWGFLTGMVRPLAGGEDAPLTGKWAYLYQRQSNGTWKIARDIYNTEPPTADECEQPGT